MGVTHCAQDKAPGRSASASEARAKRSLPELCLAQKKYFEAIRRRVIVEHGAHSSQACGGVTETGWVHAAGSTRVRENNTSSFANHACCGTWYGTAVAPFLLFWGSSLGSSTSTPHLKTDLERTESATQ